MMGFGERFANFRSSMNEKVSGLTSGLKEKVSGLSSGLISSKIVTVNPDKTVTYNEITYRPRPGGEFRDYPPRPDGDKSPQIVYKMYFNGNNNITVRMDTNTIVENPPNHRGMKSGGRRRRGTRKSKKSKKTKKSRRYKK